MEFIVTQKAIDAGSLILAGARSLIGMPYQSRIMFGSNSNVEFIWDALCRAGVDATPPPAGKANMDKVDAWMKANGFVNLCEGSTLPSGNVTNVDGHRDLKAGDIIFYEAQGAIGCVVTERPDRAVMTKARVCEDFYRTHNHHWSAIYRACALSMCEDVPVKIKRETAREMETV